MSDFDIGIHVKALWKVAFGRSLFAAVRGLNICDDRLWLIEPLFASAHWIPSRAEALFVIQTWALGAGTFSLAHFAVRLRACMCIVIETRLARILCPALVPSDWFRQLFPSKDLRLHCEMFLRNEALPYLAALPALSRQLEARCLPPSMS
jgi:hypothetical protein